MNEMELLLFTAFTVGFVHTILGPDHYLPFTVISKARDWSLKKTFWVTFVCGIAHVLSSVVLGFVGIGLGVAIFKLKAIESVRGDITAWLFLGFGFAYFIWGLHQALCKKTHQHFCVSDLKKRSNITPWVLFIIFVFGPCEPLIPLLMYPATQFNLAMLIAVVVIFAIATISTMLTIVLLSYYGLANIELSKFKRYANALAGFSIFACGWAIKLLGV